MSRAAGRRHPMSWHSEIECRTPGFRFLSSAGRIRLGYNDVDRLAQLICSSKQSRKRLTGAFLETNRQRAIGSKGSVPPL